MQEPLGANALRPRAPTGVERHFGEDDIIVSKTDTSGRITYANEVFLRIAGYTEREVLGQPHSLIRHPDMPRSVFALLWETIASGTEIFAYVVNLAKSGDHYWVFAHVTPTFDPMGRIVGYHSNRRVPNPSALRAIEPLYAELSKIERAQSDKRSAVAAGRAHLAERLKKIGLPYDALMFHLETAKEA
ncbi:MAG: PAS domain-containing protein [Sandaracinus sp.]